LTSRDTLLSFTHNGTTFNSSNSSCLKFMRTTLWLSKKKFHIFALDQIFVLRIGNINIRIMHENILSGNITVTYSNKSISCLIIKPFYFTNCSIILRVSQLIVFTISIYDITFLYSL
jgi:hypothetical protein